MEGRTSKFKETPNTEIYFFVRITLQRTIQELFFLKNMDTQIHPSRDIKIFVTCKYKGENFFPGILLSPVCLKKQNSQNETFLSINTYYDSIYDFIQ